jgi:hypothetical protein
VNLLDPRFKYVPAIKTDVLATFRRFGFKPTTDEERRARQARYESRAHTLVNESMHAILALRKSA